MMLQVKGVRVVLIDQHGRVWEVGFDAGSGEFETALLSPYRPSGLHPDPMSQLGQAIGGRVGAAILDLMTALAPAVDPVPESTGKRRSGGLVT